MRLGFNETVYRSYVVPDRFDYVLDFDVLVPLELVPADGIDVRVLDKDGDSDSDFELIGLVRVLRSDLVPGRRLRLANAGVQTLELKVEAAPQTERRTAVDMNASDGMVRAGIRVPAGAALTIRATGAYQVGSYYDAEITSDGYPGGGPSDYNLKSQPFRVAAHGAAVAILTAGSLAEGVVIGVCTHFIASGGGDLVLGINDREPRNNVGLVQFVVVTALPTIAEWRQAGVSHGCGAP